MSIELVFQITVGLIMAIIGWVVNRQVKRLDSLESGSPSKKDIAELKQGHRDLQVKMDAASIRDNASHDRIYDQINDMRADAKQDFKDLRALIKNGSK